MICVPDRYTRREQQTQGRKHVPMSPKRGIGYPRCSAHYNLFGEYDAEANGRRDPPANWVDVVALGVIAGLQHPSPARHGYAYNRPQG